METKETVLIVEGKKGNLFEFIRRFDPTIKVGRIEFLEVEERIKDGAPPLVILNLDHQEERVKEILRHFSSASPETLWVISAPDITVEDLVEFMRLGATDFLKQPVREDAFWSLIQRIHTSENIGPRQTFSFFSAKGGTGVSFAAVNFAVALARKNRGRVLLADLVLQHGNAADYLDLAPQFTWVELLKNLDRADDKFLTNSLSRHRSGVFVLPRPKEPEEAEMILTSDTARVFDLLKKMFPYLVFDVGHEINALTLSSLDLSDYIFLMTTPDLPSLCNAKLALQTFKKLNYPLEKTKLLLNRAQMKGGIDDLVIQKNILHPITHKFIDDPALVLSSLNQGVPLAELEKNARLTKSFEALVESLTFSKPEKELVHGAS